MELVIRNESDAYEILNRINQSLVAENADLQLKFEGWPIIDLRVIGEGYDATITPTIMNGLIEFQKSIYRSYALAKYNTVNINKLSKDERLELEFKVKVEKGSSKFQIDFQAVAEKFVENLVGKMTPKELILAVVTVSVLYCGHSAYGSYLENRKQIRQAELASEEQRAAIEALKFTSAQETQRAVLMAELAVSYPQVQNIKENAFVAQTELVKAVRGSDKAEIAGIAIDGDTATELVKNARKPSTEVRLDGKYRVLIVDSTDPNQFKIRIKDLESGDEFAAVVQDESLDRKYRDLIQNAEWTRTPIKLQINARDVSGEIKSAVVIKAESVKEE